MFESLTRLLMDNPSQLYTGMCVVDLDGDGVDECYAGANGGRNLVLKWGGDAFFDIGIEPLTDHLATTMGVAAGDADGDGREELYLANGEAYGDRLFAWRRGGWMDLLGGRKERGQSSQSVLALDRFGMGRFGFLVAHEGGPFRYYEVMGQDRIEEAGAVLGLARIAGGRSLVAGPILGQGLQIYAGNEGIANMLFVPNAKGQFEERAVLHGLADIEGKGRGLALIDANADGLFDIVCATARGPQRFFVQGLQSIFRDSEIEAFSEHADARSVVVADFDNDGYEEIFVHCHGQRNRLFAWRDEDWRKIDCGEAEELDGYGVGAVVGDWNGDGMLELMLGHGESMPQPLSMYGVRANGNHWLRVSPRTGPGAPARGSVVRIVSEGRSQIRVIDCGSGYLCQQEAVAHFGLGASSVVERLEVEWVDGAKLLIERPAVDQLHRIAYPNQGV